MFRLAVSITLLGAVASCSPYPSYGEAPLTGDMRYRVIVDVPGLGQQTAEDRFLPFCQQKRYKLISTNVGAKLVEDCHVVNIKGQ